MAKSNSPPSTGPVRLSKLMSERGLCSRREADEYIARGLVQVNGEIVNVLGTKVDASAKVLLLKEAKISQSRLVTVLLNKPMGYVSAQPEKDYKPAIQLLGEENCEQILFDDQQRNPKLLNNLAVCGRLDIDSTGLLIFSQDGRVAKRLIGEETETEKEYLVRVETDDRTPPQKYLTNDLMSRLRFGLEMDGAPLKRAGVEWLNEDQLRFVLIEGKKRQIRRMCEAVGLHVTGLKRVRVGNVRLGDLPVGKWRYLRPEEAF